MWIKSMLVFLFCFCFLRYEIGKCACIVLAICRCVMTQTRHCRAHWVGDKVGCSCSLIIIKRQTSLALRILYCDIWPLCLAARTEQTRFPSLPTLEDNILYVWHVVPVWLFSFCNLKITFQVAMQSMAVQPFGVYKERNTQMRVNGCLDKCALSLFLSVCCVVQSVCSVQCMFACDWTGQQVALLLRRAAGWVAAEE